MFRGAFRGLGREGSRTVKSVRRPEAGPEHDAEGHTGEVARCGGDQDLGLPGGEIVGKFPGIRATATVRSGVLESAGATARLFERVAQGWRLVIQDRSLVEVTERRTKMDFAHRMRWLVGVDYGRGQNPTLRILPTDSGR